MSRLYRMMLAAAACVGIAACSDQLTVVNPNNPETERALTRPTDVEALISGSFNTMWRATLGATNIPPQAYTLGMENYSSLANENMGVRASIPRPPIVNFRGNAVATQNYSPYLGLARAARAAAIGLAKVNDPTFTFFPTSANQTARARAFAHFVIGVSLGQMAMVYDSGSAVNEHDDLTISAPLPFLNYDSLAGYALAKLDSAAAISPASGTLGYPGTWFSASATAVTNAQFVGLVRGWQARIRAGVARTPAERAAVNCTRIISDAAAFNTAWAGADFSTLMTPAQGWSAAWPAYAYNSNSVNWHMTWGYMAGFAASQVDYDAWLATAPAVRAQYLIVTPDQRWPQGATRIAQQCQSGSVTGASCTGLPTTAGAFLYQENRSTGNDWIGADPSAASMYRHRRWLAFRNASSIGQYTSMTAAEMNLLQAEGQLIAGNFAAAAALIDLTRVGHGVLPALTGVVLDGVTPVPGGANCVPRIPVGPSFTSSACGNMMEALKYEKRVETQYTAWTNWWIDGRGWGDMPASTPPSWPVPYQEMDTRSQVFYDMSGLTSAPGRYGI